MLLFHADVISISSVYALFYRSYLNRIPCAAVDIFFQTADMVFFLRGHIKDFFAT